MAEAISVSAPISGTDRTLSFETGKLAQLADGQKCEPSAILRLTAEHSPNAAYPANVAAYINGVFRGTIAATDHMPAGLHLYLP